MKHMKPMTKTEAKRMKNLEAQLMSMGAAEHEAAVDLRNEWDTLCDKKAASAKTAAEW